MEYLLLVIVALSLGANFCIQKLYQSRIKHLFHGAFIATFVSGFLVALLFLIITAFKPEFTWFSFGMAALYTSLCAFYSLLGYKIMSIGKVAVYTLFLMLGGMFLPFLYGVIFLNESISLFKILALVILIGALIMPVLEKSEGDKPKNKLFYILCFIVFIANGFVSITSKAHQINVNAVNSNSFMVWVAVCNLIISIIVLTVSFIKAGKTQSGEIVKNVVTPKNIGILVLSAAVGNVGGFLIIYCAKTVDASVLFPLVTCGAIIATAVFGRLFFKEKIGRYALISVLLAVAATVLFIF